MLRRRLAEDRGTYCHWDAFSSCRLPLLLGFFILGGLVRWRAVIPRGVPPRIGLGGG